MQKTKMIFTIGPASETEEVLTKLIEAGMSASRHNFSHGDHEEHGARIKNIKRLREKYNKNIAIILDTKGPEIRTGDFVGDVTNVKEGNPFTVVCGEQILGDETKCSVTFDKLHEDVKSGDMILIDDGLVELDVQSVEGNKIHCIIKNNGTIGNHKGVNVPGVSINLPALTEKDISDLVFGAEIGVDMIAASFIRKASDVLAIRKVLDENGGNDIQIISKIENSEGVQNVDDIIKFSDAIMVARGDMGVEIPIEEVPLVQKMIIEKCNKAGKPVITATQMLDSMIRNPRPTRAEVSDVANAILDGSDAIMLSGETANGKYPVEAGQTMARIAKEVETTLNYESIFNKKRKAHVKNVPNAISVAAVETAMEINAAAIVSLTRTGTTAKRLSKYRPECPVIAVTPYASIARKLSLNWGVISIVVPGTDLNDILIDESQKVLVKNGVVKKGDLLIITTGIPIYNSGTTNMLKVHIVGDKLVEGSGVGSKSAGGTANIVDSYNEAEDSIQEGDILVVKKLEKEYIPLLDKVAGVVAEEGGFTSHMAIECISKEIPLVCFAKDATNIIKTGTYITIDVSRGVVYSGRTNVAATDKNNI